MVANPKRPFSLRAMAVLRKLLPRRLYLRYVGRHEQGSMRLWRGIVKRLPAKACVLDIGAYHGEYALAARSAGPELRIHAFEPNPGAMGPLTEACAEQVIGVENVAVAEKAGEKSFLVDGKRSQILRGSDEIGERTVVRAVTLDQWAEERGLLPSLLKVDVEGGEAAIFRGGRRTLECARPIILCEVLTDQAGAEVAAALPEKYLFFEVNEDRGPKKAEHPTRRLWRYCNWLLVPAERENEIDVW